jgi:hypothetical protein
MPRLVFKLGEQSLEARSVQTHRSSRTTSHPALERSNGPGGEVPLAEPQHAARQKRVGARHRLVQRGLRPAKERLVLKRSREVASRVGIRKALVRQKRDPVRRFPPIRIPGSRADGQEPPADAREVLDVAAPFRDAAGNVPRQAVVRAHQIQDHPGSPFRLGDSAAGGQAGDRKAVPPDQHL